MRRIHACMLFLGIAGILSIGLTRGSAQTAPDPAKKEVVLPTTYANMSKPSGSPMTSNPGVPLDAPLTVPVIPESLPLPPIPPLENTPNSSPKTNVPLPPGDFPKPLPSMPEPAVIPSIPSSPSGGEAAYPAPRKETPKKTEPMRNPAPQPMLQPGMGPLESLPRTVEPKAVPVPNPVRTDVTMPPVKVEPQPKQTNPPATTFQPSPRNKEVPMLGHAPSAIPNWAANRIAPCVTIESKGPETVAYGQNIVYEILVKNVGQMTVTHVRVDDELTSGARLVSSEPAAEVTGTRMLWMLGTMQAGEEKKIKVTVRPGLDGDLKTRPQLSYSAQTQMQVRITRPNLALTLTGPNSSQVDEEVPLQIQVTNTGSGDATNVILKASLSDGLKHPEGKEIEATLNRLAPGESQSITLKVQACSTGSQQCTLTAACEGSPKASAKATVQVTQPKLNITMSGPQRCVVRAEPTFNIEIANPGTSATQPVQVAVAFPEGLDVIQASEGGLYDAATRTLNWNLGPAETGSKRMLTVRTRSTVAGNLAVRAVAQAGPKLHARAESIIHAEGIPAIMFEVVNHENPIEIGKETTYEIRVVNTGTTACTNIRIAAALSDGLTPISATGPVPYKTSGQVLQFEPIPRLAVKGDAVIKVKAKSSVTGDLRFKVQLSCDQLKLPIVKEESTTFFMP